MLTLEYIVRQYSLLPAVHQPTIPKVLCTHDMLMHTCTYTVTQSPTHLHYTRLHYTTLHTHTHTLTHTHTHTHHVVTDHASLSLCLCLVCSLRLLWTGNYTTYLINHVINTCVGWIYRGQSLQIVLVMSLPGFLSTTAVQFDLWHILLLFHLADSGPHAKSHTLKCYKYAF